MFVALACRHDLLQFVGAEHRVHFRNVLADVVAIPFHQAAGDDEPSCTAGFLVLGHLQNGFDRFLFRGIDEAARIDHQGVGFRRIVRELVPSLDELAHHDLGIDKVLGAAETYKTNFQGG